jgi:MFS family permease
VSGALEPGLCNILHPNFEEYPFHALRCITSSWIIDGPCPCYHPGLYAQGQDVIEEPSAVEATSRPDPGGTLAVAAAASLVVLVTFTTPLTTLGSTAAGLDAGPGAQAWVLSAMPVGAAAGLLSSGAIGDDYGRRRTFLAGTLLLARSSLLGALAPNAPVLIVARILQGIGGAAMLSCGLGLIGHAFPGGPGRVRATGVWGAAVGAGNAVGPILAAGIAALGGWRLAYGTIALSAAALALVGWKLLSEWRAARPRPVDAAGTLLIGLGLAAIMVGLVEGRTGWTQPTVIALMALGLALVVAFVAVERRIKHPMLDLALFGRPDFMGATVAALASGLGGLALTSLVPLVLERDLGVGAVLASVVLLAWVGDERADRPRRPVGAGAGVSTLAAGRRAGGFRRGPARAGGPHPRQFDRTPAARAAGVRRRQRGPQCGPG